MEGEKEKEVVYLYPDDIVVPEPRCTSVMTEEQQREFYESVRRFGVKQPILVYRDKEGRLILVDGLHRCLAASKFGQKVPAIIEEGDLWDALAWNIQTARQKGREDPAATALVIRRMVDELKLSWEEVAQRMAMSPVTAKKYYKISFLDPFILDLVKSKQIGIGHAEALLQLPNPEDRIEVAKDAARWGYTVEMVQERIKQILRPSYQPTKFEFVEAGEPKGVYPTCDLCGAELRERSWVLYTCRSCNELVLTFWREYTRPRSSDDEPPKLGKA